MRLRRRRVWLRLRGLTRPRSRTAGEAGRLPRLRLLDWLVLATATALVALSALSVYKPGGGELSVFISGEGGEWVYPLDKDREVEVDGPLGSTIVAIEGGRVHIHSSPCPNQTCVAAGAISQAGQWIACMPNAVFVRVEGNATNDTIDAGAY